ncbi:SMC-Scp complex subunit ScpB [Botrimarina mediterranea]|uniref:Segregation and condensation protein B n=1 Tax=Botrimarina mediterranea TaxID=2528022 RepID=A0A518KER8_9BACT|nr:SMC-Scp complex subunit ScpB [Botrimarina mediterranea]QDV76278.1 Segregation and condensation protein B [Botrimarina mediterranea]QDV80876.1 Segregation and condensation protein B [Planctomycetes bacterium K2D]
MHNPAASDDAEGPVTLPMSRLRAAFARMLDNPSATVATPDPDAVTPEGIVEAILFVGRADDRAITAEEIAAVIRDVSADEVAGLVDRLNQRYEDDGGACRIEQNEQGFRLAIIEEHDGVVQRLGGKARAARLSSAALECLAVVAYRQPIAAVAIDALRGAPSGPTLRRLERRGLIRADASQDAPEGPLYATTARFLEVLGLANLRQLPRVEELDD